MRAYLVMVGYAIADVWYSIAEKVRKGVRRGTK